MRNAGLDEAQAMIRIAGRNINNLRYADDTTLMAESEIELKSLLDESEIGEWKSSLKLNIQKTKIMASGWSHHLMANRWRKMKTVTGFIFLGFKITVDGDCSHEIKRCLPLGRKIMTNLDSILKSRDITLLTKVCLDLCLVRGHVWIWELDCKESWVLKIDASELWCWKRLLRVP